jgi:hypothetical protein
MQLTIVEHLGVRLLRGFDQLKLVANRDRGGP